MPAYTQPHQAIFVPFRPLAAIHTKPWRNSPIRVATLQAWSMLRYYNAWKDHDRKAAEKYFAVADRCARLGRLITSQA